MEPEGVTQLLLCVHKVQMAKEQVEYFMKVYVFCLAKCMFMLCIIM